MDIINRERDVSSDQETKKKVVREDNITEVIEEKVVQLRRDAGAVVDTVEEREENSMERDVEAVEEDLLTTKIVMKEEKRVDHKELMAATEEEVVSEAQEEADVADTAVRVNFLPMLKAELKLDQEVETTSEVGKQQDTEADSEVIEAATEVANVVPEVVHQEITPDHKLTVALDLSMDTTHREEVETKDPDNPEVVHQEVPRDPNELSLVD